MPKQIHFQHGRTGERIVLDDDDLQGIANARWNGYRDADPPTKAEAAKAETAQKPTAPAN